MQKDELLEWQRWGKNNHDLFKDLKPGSRVGFLSKEDLDQPQGRVVVLEVGRQGLDVYYLPFTGMRQLAVDVLFVAESEILAQIKETSATHEGGRLFRQLLSLGQIHFYYLAKAKDLMRKGFMELFSNLGLESLGGCVN
ncbi:MAG: hypothetical protein QW334_03955 [Thermofilum sp.]